MACVEIKYFPERNWSGLFQLKVKSGKLGKSQISQLVKQFLQVLTQLFDENLEHRHMEIKPFSQ